MSDANVVKDFYDMTARVLIRCFFIGMLFMLPWFLIIMVAGEWAHSIHKIWFEITWHEFQVMNYCALGLFKISLFVFFLLPYIAIRLAQRNK